MPYKDRAAKLRHGLEYYAAHKHEMLSKMRDRGQRIRAGEITVHSGNLREQLMRHVDKHDGHWLWTGHLDPKGYGRVNAAGVTQLAHRVAYQEFVGPIPDGLTLDHLCRVHACVNPAHLEPVTALENWTRGIPGMTKGRCWRGHESAKEACYVRGRYVYCRACRREDAATLRSRLSEAGN